MTDRIQQLQAMLERDPGDPFCLYGLAMEHAKAGALEDAVDCYQRAIEADPDFCYAYYHLARAHEQRDETDAAIETLQAGRRRAEALRDEQALSEIDAYLELLQ